MTQRKKQYPWQKNYPEGIEWDINITPLPLYSILDDAAAKYPDNPCIDFFGQKYTYSEIHEAANKMAAGLQKYGVKKGMKVGILLPNCPQFVISYYAILKVGAVVVNYNPLYTIHELSEQVKNSDTKLMVTLNLVSLFEKTSNLLQTTMLERVIVASFQDVLPFTTRILFNMFKSDQIASVPFGHINISLDSLMDNNGHYQAVEIKPAEDLAVLQYTGGTTGTPKGAMLTHANLYANAVQTGMWFHGLEEGNEKIMGILPLFHVFAMTVVMNLGVLKACEMILHPRLDIKKLLKEIESKKPTILPGVPTLFTAINNQKNIKNYDLKSIKACISGGAPLPLEVREKFEELTECTLIEGYGLTESSPVATANPLFGENRSGSIGLPFPATIVEIRETEGRRNLCSTDKIGEICIKGPQVMLGYYNNDQETKETIRSGRLHTGDLGYMDKDGYVYVVDRSKEMIIVSGFNVYPREVEEEIYKHSSVEEAAVLGIGDDYKGQTVKAFIKLKKSAELSEEELNEFLKGKLAKYKLPKEIEFRDEMPKTLIGKISKKDLIKEK